MAIDPNLVERYYRSVDFFTLQGVSIVVQTLLNRAKAKQSEASRAIAVAVPRPVY